MSPTSETPSAEAVPPRTTPTWEMELLISGATVFGLLQLPDLADRLLFQAHNSGPVIVAAFVLPLWIYVKSALLTLAATFVVHLCLRGYWVGLVGLASVYPAGFRWDRIAERAGPQSLAWMRATMGEVPDAIERADNRASRVFAMGFAVATMLLVPIAMVLVLMTVMWAVARVLGDFAYIVEVGFLVFLLLPLPFAFVVWWDRRRGATIAPDGPEARRIRRALDFYRSIGLGQANNPLLVLFSSNEGNRKTGVVLGLAMGITFAIMFVQAVGPRKGWEFGDYAGLPDDLRAAPDMVLPIHYASQRGDVIPLVPVPIIPDPVVRGPYLRLFVPYFPRRNGEAMRIACPQALADGATARARLDCLATLHAVAIDGVPVTVPFDAAEDPKTGQRGVLAMIPMAGLAPGRHELTVMPAPLARDRREGAKPLEPYRIPFWR